MRVLETRWFPLLACVVVAEVNFWYFASTGGNEADYAGIALFGLGAIYFLQSAIARPWWRTAALVAGSGAALALMILREVDVYDRGYLPPYVVFAVAVLLAYALPE